MNRSFTFRSWLPALSSILAASCNVSPHMREPLPPAYPDASVDAGSSSDAAAPSCLRHEIACPDGQYCTGADQCVPIPTTCMVSSDCAPGSACRGGMCQKRPDSCTDRAQCAANETCTSVHLCGAAFTEDGKLLSRCTGPSDCGPGGICRDGACVGCAIDGDCPGTLACLSGACVERTACAAATDCFSGNACLVHSAPCTKSTAGCTADPGNDMIAGADPLMEAWKDGLSICGDDVDWYKLSLDAGKEAKIILTTSTAAGLTADVTDGTAAPLADAARLFLPRLLVFDVPPVNTARAVYLKVSGPVSTSYAVEVRTQTATCGGDMFDLYGERDPKTAPVVSDAVTLHLRACTGGSDFVRVAISQGDKVTIKDHYGHATRLDFEVLDAMGRQIGFSAPTSTTSSTAQVLTLPPAAVAETVALHVSNHGTPQAGEPYTLTILRPNGARAAACTSIRTVPISFDLGTASGSLSRETDLGAAQCPEYSSADRNDAIFQITPPSAPVYLDLEVFQTNASTVAASSTVSIALLSKCRDDLSALACANSKGAALSSNLPVASLRQRLTTADPVFLMISSDAKTEDVAFGVGLAFERTAEPASDQCAAATVLDADGFYSASTFGAVDSADLTAPGVCGEAGSGPGPDRFFKITVGAHQRAAVELIGDGAFLWVARDCMRLTETCTAAAKAGPGAPAIVELHPGAATNYYLVADSVAAGGAGDWILRLVHGSTEAGARWCFDDRDCGSQRCDDYRCAPPPANTACPGLPITLSGGYALISGSTGAANDNYLATCAVSSGVPDVVYSVFVPDGTTSLTARIVEAEWDPLLAIEYGGCDDRRHEVACNDDIDYPRNVLPDTSVLNPPSGTYFITVDGYAGKGAFMLEVIATP